MDTTSWPLLPVIVSIISTATVFPPAARIATSFPELPMRLSTAATLIVDPVFLSAMMTSLPVVPVSVSIASTRIVLPVVDHAIDPLPTIGVPSIRVRLTTSFPLPPISVERLATVIVLSVSRRIPVVRPEVPPTSISTCDTAIVAELVDESTAPVLKAVVTTS